MPENHPFSEGTCTESSAGKLRQPCLQAIWKRLCQCKDPKSQSRYSFGTQQEVKDSKLSIRYITGMLLPPSLCMTSPIGTVSSWRPNTGSKISGRMLQQISFWPWQETKVTCSSSRKYHWEIYNSLLHSTKSN